jgi:hypothetical protein
MATVAKAIIVLRNVSPSVVTVANVRAMREHPRRYQHEYCNRTHNMSWDILLWSKIGYRFVKRQSQYDPNVWVSLGDSAPATATATSP